MPLKALTDTATAGANGWDKATAIGTLLAAAATVAAVLAALLIGRRDRQSAEKTAEADRAAARLQQAAQHRLELAVSYLIEVNRAFRNEPSDVIAYLHAIPKRYLPAARAHWLQEKPAGPLQASALTTDPSGTIRAEAVGFLKYTEQVLREGWQLDPRGQLKTVTVERKAATP